MPTRNKISTPRSPSFFREVFEKYSADDCTLLAAAISFYALLSIIPLLFLGVAFLGYLMGSSEGAVDRVIIVITDLLPLPAVDWVEKLLHSVIATKTVASILAILSFLWVGNGAFEKVEQAINIIHRARETRGYIHRKLMGFLIMVTSGTLLLLSFLISPLLWSMWSFTRDLLSHFELLAPFVSNINNTVATLWKYLALPLPFFLMWVVFLLIYYLAPAQAVPFSSAMLGAATASILWQTAKTIYGYYLLYYARYNQLYGPLGALVGLVLWVYCTAIILLLGAEISEVHFRRRFQKRRRM